MNKKPTDTDEMNECPLHANNLRRWHWLADDIYFFIRTIFCYWNFALVYFWNNLNVNTIWARATTTTAATITATTKVLNTHISVHVLTCSYLWLLLRKRYRLDFFFAFAALNVLLSNALRWLCLKLANADKWVFAFVFWHVYANFIWKQNMNCRAFSKAIDVRFLLTTI